ncbi:tyrosyl-DNA phosphodiesterase-domain-containing protein [Coniella lustricola]|uniref:Tyrosyl-DNA phosphodiesterase-domain-containing protein n=1 Tax=Coniella lustricola TaxID=2025994 RepID=A0A2T3A5K9_9PEZI|nr:tyrosyl-DNA phosphodiesterase-domain-containing protein [Coniella lustricola]
MSLGQDFTDDKSAGSSHVQRIDDLPHITPTNQQDEVPPPPTPTTLLGLDRKKMEQERLERLKKRKADTMLGPSGDSNPAERVPPAQRPKLTSRQPTGHVQSPTKPKEAARLQATNDRCSSTAPNSAPLAYRKGVVLKTWAQGVRRDSDIKIEEVFQKDELQLAVLSSFQWDEEWLMSKLNMKQTKVILIAYAKDEEQKTAMRNNTPSNLIRFVFPPMGGAVGCMHSKLQLLKYPKSLRIVVPTGNLVSYDWGEGGIMENMVFLIDLPRLENPAERPENTLTPFGEDLCYFLRAQGVDENIIQSLLRYDFSETARFGFVHTIAGSHSEPGAWSKTGYCGLGRSVASLGLASTDANELHYICSSIGAVNRDLLSALYNACQGDDGLKEYEDRTAKPKKGKAFLPNMDSVDSTRFRVYFPSRETVARSQGGRNSAGTICFQKKWWNLPTFPREILRDSKNVRPGPLLHTKMIIVQRVAAGTDGSRLGWAYVGSHNLSESAWGRLVKNRTTGQPKLTARNWECGVLVLSSNAASQASGTGSNVADMKGVFDGTIPIPIELPGQPYDDNSREPWFNGQG